MTFLYAFFRALLRLFKAFRGWLSPPVGQTAVQEANRDNVRPMTANEPVAMAADASQQGLTDPLIISRDVAGAISLRLTDESPEELEKKRTQLAQVSRAFGLSFFQKDRLLARLSQFAAEAPCVSIICIHLLVIHPPGRLQ